MFTFRSNYKTPALLRRHCCHYSCLNAEKMADKVQLSKGGNMLIEDSPSAVVGGENKNGLIIETV